MLGLLGASCVQDPEFEPTPTVEPVNKIIGNANEALSGELIIYVDEATAEAWHSASAPTRSGIVALDAVAAEMEVESVRPVFNMSINADKKRERGMHRWFVVEFAEDTPVESVAQRYAAMEEVERVEYATTFARPEVNVVPVESLPATRSDSEPFNDPMLPQQWHLINTGDQDLVPHSVAGADLGVKDAWRLCTGDTRVIVAVFDIGVAATLHPDLIDVMWTNPSEDVNGKDDDGNGYKDDVNGFNFYSNKGKLEYTGDSKCSHGTHVAGSIAARNGNGIGVSSIAGGSGAA